jgi:hypothetical protein
MARLSLDEWRAAVARDPELAERVGELLERRRIARRVDRSQQSIADEDRRAGRDRRQSVTKD